MRELLLFINLDCLLALGSKSSLSSSVVSFGNESEVVLSVRGRPQYLLIRPFAKLFVEWVHFIATEVVVFSSNHTEERLRERMLEQAGWSGLGSCEPRQAAGKKWTLSSLGRSASEADRTLIVDTDDAQWHRDLQHHVICCPSADSPIALLSSLYCLFSVHALDRVALATSYASAAAFREKTVFRNCRFVVPASLSHQDELSMRIVRYGGTLLPESNADRASHIIYSEQHHTHISNGRNHTHSTTQEKTKNISKPAPLSSMTTASVVDQEFVYWCCTFGFLFPPTFFAGHSRVDHASKQQHGGSKISLAQKVYFSDICRGDQWPNFTLREASVTVQRAFQVACSVVLTELICPPSSPLLYSYLQRILHQQNVLNAQVEANLFDEAAGFLLTPTSTASGPCILRKKSEAEVQNASKASHFSFLNSCLCNEALDTVSPPRRSSMHTDASIQCELEIKPAQVIKNVRVHSTQTAEVSLREMGTMTMNQEMTAKLSSLPDVDESEEESEHLGRNIMYAPMMGEIGGGSEELTPPRPAIITPSPSEVGVKGSPKITAKKGGFRPLLSTSPKPNQQNNEPAVVQSTGSQQPSGFRIPPPTASAPSNGVSNNGSDLRKREKRSRSPVRAVGSMDPPTQGPRTTTPLNQQVVAPPLPPPAPSTPAPYIGVSQLELDFIAGVVRDLQIPEDIFWEDPQGLQFFVDALQGHPKKANALARAIRIAAAHKR